MAPALPGHHGNTVGGQPPPPMVRSVKYSGAVAVTERTAPAHSAVQEGVGTEATEFGGVGGKGGNLKGVQRLWVTP